jgi:aminoglycoside phosphotransferase (APT) family kinase protein
VVKYGPGVEEREGQNLLFLERQLGSLFIPKLYAMYRSLADGHVYLIMERMPGETLEKLWPLLKETEKSQICAKTRAILAVIRQIPAAGFYGSVDGGPISHHMLWITQQDSTIHGPFKSEQELNMGFVKKLRRTWAMNNKHSYKADFYERQLGHVLKDHQPVFTHTDIQKKNIIVERISADDFRVSLVDWEYAGWYPSYWEYAAIYAALEWKDDWPMWFEQIVEPWIAEAAVIRMIFQDIFF